MPRTAVVIYNLGGPDSLEAVQPFLFNLFNDPLILRQPSPISWILAKIISSRRAPIAKEIYGEIGGRSPILEETKQQAEALQKVLGPVDTYRVFVAMRYWHPYAEECLDEVLEFEPDKIVLLPLYPQFSTTTTESFMRVWKSIIKRRKLDIPTMAICSYPNDKGFIRSISALLRDTINRKDENLGAPKILFSAHGIPKKFVEAGDPYQKQIEITVDAILDELSIPDLDYITCYQSRVGPVEWLKPYTDEVIINAAEAARPIIVVPIAFVSEHSETLVELDIEYRDLAIENGAPSYLRVPTVKVQDEFITGLAELVRIAASTTESVPGVDGQMCSICPLS